MAESKEIRFPNWFCSPSHYLSFLFFFLYYGSSPVSVFMSACHNQFLSGGNVLSFFFPLCSSLLCFF